MISKKRRRDLSDIAGSMTKAEAQELECLIAEADRVDVAAHWSRDLSFLLMSPEDVAAIREAHEMCDQVYPEE